MPGELLAQGVPEMGFSKSLESFIHYKAPKYVEVRSLNLGLLSKAPIFLIFLYIVGYQILWGNKHLGKSRPSGMARLQLQRPTEHHCNPNHAKCEADFTAIDDLNYCLPNTEAPFDEKQGEAAGGKLPCRFLDEKQMNPVGFQHFTIMIPTRVTKTTQKASGNCGPDSTKECKNVFEFTEDKEESVYVADVERYTLLIETAFTLPPEDQVKTPVRRGASNDFPGFWEVCDNPRKHDGCQLVKIPCRMPGCDGPDSHPDRRLLKRRLRGLDNETSPVEDRSLADDGKAKEAKESAPNFFGLAFGDVIPVGELLKISGVDLDQDTDTHGESRRSTGIALQIDVDFENRKRFSWPPWGSSHDIAYVYRVSKLPFQTYKEVSEEVHGDKRVLIDKHGIFVNVNIEGSILFFDITQTLLILTTGLSLLAGANAAVNFFASNLWKHKEEYKMEKTDRSRNYDRDENLCFCCNVTSQPEAEEKSWQYFNEHPEEFTKDLRALDGDTLKCAGELLMALHRMRSREVKDNDFVQKEIVAWKGEEEERRSAEAAPTPEATQGNPREMAPLIG